MSFHASLPRLFLTHNELNVHFIFAVMISNPANLQKNLLQEVNETLKPANVKVVPDASETLKRKAVLEALGEDVTLDTGKVKDETANLTGDRKADKNVINVYVVPNIRRKNLDGSSVKLSGKAKVEINSIFISAHPVHHKKDTFAHELGHLFFGPGHVDDPYNLMADGGKRKGSNLTKEQIEIIQKSRFVKH